MRYSAWAATTPQGQQRHAASVLFRQPGKVEPYELLAHARSDEQAGVRVFTIDPAHIRRREGFALTDAGTDLRGALDETNYCIWCHNQGKDSCSKGLKEKPGPDARPAFKKTVFGVPLAGCPLEERISEFQLVKARGHALAALAIIAIDNPMVAATGHRICNDCMKACIYQKQSPVDIPQAETRTLKDVLELPWGFEIYSLLTRWNPLDIRRAGARPADRLQGAGGRHGTGRLHARAPPAQRRSRGGRHRRPEDRAAPGFGQRCRRAGRARGRSSRSRTSTPSTSRSTTA